MNATSTSPRFAGLDLREATLALRMACAALLAFSIAALLHVQNAYWAAMPVWVVAQSQRGLLLERGFFRILGTLLGATVGFVLIQVTHNPFVLFLLLGLWVALSAGATHLLPGVVAYGATLAGMTAAVVVLPSVDAPQHMLDLASARVECTLIGVVVVTLVTGFYTPASPRQDFYARIRRLCADAVDFAAQAVSGVSSGETPDSGRRVLTELSEADAAARIWAAGSLDGYRRLRASRVLVSSALSLMAAAVAVRGRIARGAAVEEGLAARMAAHALALRNAAPGAGAAAPHSTPPSARSGPAARLHDAMASLEAAERALFAIEPSATRLPPTLSPPRDGRRARISGLVSGIGTFVVASLGHLSGWGAAELMALGVCIFAMVLGALPEPRSVAPKMIIGVAVGVVVAAAYRLFVQPHVHGTVALILSVTPMIAAGAWTRVHPRTAAPALDANMCFMLGSQAGMPAVPGGVIASGSAALMLAALLVAGGFLLAPEGRAARLRHAKEAIRRDLARMVTHRPSAMALDAWQARMNNRLQRRALDLQRLQRNEGNAIGLLAILNIGHSLAALARSANDTPAAQAVRAALSERLDDPEAAAQCALTALGIAPSAPLTDSVHDLVDALRQSAPA
ncbi:FUSC family protein [Variovorax ginsengisoli]|uniref:Membrane protein YccC n=1 Tax=Variovorax ginsengisoli TaxID=363844 RepID=A0ABT9S124_9BURK|nr:FUSC family protein [Variovorax ginsengisoli]MDP9898041.1 putative membrane protein YccC [Variovorax ginsengisoli]